MVFVYICYYTVFHEFMFKQIITSVLFLILGLTTEAQTIEKVKGNKIVTSIQTEINPFHTISVDEDFEVELIYNQTTSVIIETDENLHEYIKFQVQNGVLTFDKTAKITSKKQLRITVNYDASLNNIKTTDKSDVLSLTTMELQNALVISEGSSRTGLTIKTNQFEFQGNGKSKVALNITCENAQINLNENCKMDALIYTPKAKIDLYQRATATIEGETDELALRTDNFSTFDGKNFTTKTANTLHEISSNAYLEVLENITIDASGSSNIYLYGSPKIIINKFENTAKLQKKEK